MKNILMCIPFKFNSLELERKKNLLYVLKNLVYFSQKFPYYTKIVVCEQGKSKEISLELKNIFPSIDFIFIYNPNNFFNRSWAFNTTYKLYENYSYYMFVDGDVLLSLNDYIKYFSLLEKYNIILKPRYYKELNQNTTYMLINKYNYFSDNIDIIKKEKLTDIIWKNVGVMAIFEKKTFEYLQGWDERFEGWGYEDTALYKLILKNNISHIFPELTYYHLWHPKNPKTGNYNNIHINQKLCEEYDNPNFIPEPLKNKGNINKYINNSNIA